MQHSTFIFFKIYINFFLKMKPMLWHLLFIRIQCHAKNRKFVCYWIGDILIQKKKCFRNLFRRVCHIYEAIEFLSKIYTFLVDWNILNESNTCLSLIYALLRKGKAECYLKDWNTREVSILCCERKKMKHLVL